MIAEDRVEAEGSFSLARTIASFYHSLLDAHPHIIAVEEERGLFVYRRLSILRNVTIDDSLE